MVGQLAVCVHVIDGPVEEALDLIGMQVDRDDAIGAGGLEQVCDQASGDRLASAVLLVLAGVRVEREHCSDALCRSTLESVDHDELLHHPRVQRCRMTLQDKRVGAANGLFESNEDLAVREVARGLRGDADVEFLRHLLRQLGMCATREQHQVLLVVDPIRSHWFMPSFCTCRSIWW